MNTWMKRAALGLFALLFVTAAVLTVVTPEPAVATAINELVLPDGRVLRVEAVTVGKSHVYRNGPEWLEKLQRGGPRWLRDKLGPEVRTMRHTTPDETAMPWISLSTLPGASSDVWKDLHVVSDAGEAFDVGSRSFPGSLKDRRFMLPRLDTFPRRDPFFSLTGYVANVPFSLRVPNPLHGKTFPTWTSGPIPATNHVGGFDVVLDNARFIRSGTGEYFSAGFTAFESGVERKDWFNFSWKLTDATGNEGYRLSTNEPAWRMEASLSRKFAARWATNEFRQITLMNLPPDGELREFGIAANLGGVDCPRAWIAGPGEYVMENGVFTIAKPLPPGGGDRWSSSSSGPSDWEIQLKRTKPWIMVENSAPSPDHLVTVFLIDAEGAEMPVWRRGASGWSHIRADMFEIGPLKRKHAGPFTLRVAGDRYLRTDFTFAPDQVRRDNRRK